MTRFNVLMVAFVAMLVSIGAQAQIDVSGALTEITNGSTAVVAIIGALLVAYGLFLGLRMALRAVKRGG